MKAYFLPVLTILSLTATAQDCPKVSIADFPKKDLPPAAFTSKGNKSSVSYYYGLGVPINYETARYMAFREFDREDIGPLEGASVLLMLYANGYGVKRDLDLCIRLACGNVGFAPAEIEGRIQHLKDIKSGASHDTFDICDDITSGYMMGFCTSIVTERNEYERQAQLERIVRRWPAKDTAAFGRLHIAATNYFEARTANEVDLSGTAWATMSMTESDSLETNFVNRIHEADMCSMHGYSVQDFTTADAELNAVYKKVMGTKSDGWGTVTRDGIKVVQRAWLKYRDAWATFGKTHCPQIPEETWKTILTKERIVQLRDFQDN